MAALNPPEQEQSLRKRTEHNLLEQIDPFVLPIALLGPIYAFFILLDVPEENNRTQFYIWFVLVMYTSVQWVINYTIFKKRLMDNQKFIYLGAVSGFLGGLVWCYPALFMIAAGDKEGLYFFILVVMTIHSAPQLSVSQIPAFHLSFIIGSFLPLIIRPFYLDEPSMYWLSPVLLWIAVALVIFGRIGFKVVEKNTSLMLENEWLFNKVLQEKAEVEAANEAKTRFLAAASHDLRQPLQAQRFLIAALKSKNRDNSQNDLLEKLTDTSQTLSDLLNSLLDISRLDANVIHPQVQTFYLHELLLSLVNELSPLADNKNIRLKYLPCSRWVKSDPVLLGNIIRNLLSNAIRYTQKGHILLACKNTDKEHFVIQVRDTGIGIPQKERKKIFEEFYQLNNPGRDRSKGLGLGLSIVKRLSALLEHTITLETGRKRGTCFSIELNACQPPAVIAETDQQTENYLADKSVLIIDDDYLIRDALTELLDQWQCYTRAADGIKSAVEVAKNRHIDIILSDYKLQNYENGINAIHAVRKSQNRNTPAILLTGETSPEQLAHLQQSGFQILHKPIDSDELKTALNRLLSEQSNPD